MKCASKNLLFLIALAVTQGFAQNQPNTPFKHVVVVIQENRTPDNLFQQDQALISNGGHIASQGSAATVCFH